MSAMKNAHEHNTRPILIAGQKPEMWTIVQKSQPGLETISLVEGKRRQKLKTSG